MGLYEFRDKKGKLLGRVKGKTMAIAKKSLIRKLTTKEIKKEVKYNKRHGLF